MSRSQSPRKPRHAKVFGAPITPHMLAKLCDPVHLSMTALQQGNFSRFDDSVIASFLNLVCIASGNKRQASDASQIRELMRVVTAVYQDIRARYEASGQWATEDGEIDTILTGIECAEDWLRRQSSSYIRAAIETLNAMADQHQEEQAA